MEGCGMSEPLLLSGGWSRRKDWRRASQHWVGGGWVVGEYSTPIMQWKCGVQLYNSEWGLDGRVVDMPEKWTAGIQQSIDDGHGVGGYRWPNPWCKEYRGGSQHWVGGGKAVGWEVQSDYAVEMLWAGIPH
ncbi:conserved hypothetical protein [Trichinella spiralis]|uniref:hypothetical protein n=1 Tax=Trichinella spiralis TaxID=6334 RepID=UPI0001EFE0D5|nr:conserved hypothetical protein [Trichinella spiralis]